MNYLSDFKKSLISLGFKPKDGEDGVYVKSYSNTYNIHINYDEKNSAKSTIDYGGKIICHRETTCNFLNEESFVVLECVDRLLKKGYKPENIELEKCWNLGHKDKGFLDVWVKDLNNKSFLIVECKTWGKEYERFVKETIVNKKRFGGQIFSYLQQEPKDTKAICYYTSTLNENDEIEYRNAIVYNKEEWKHLNQEERYKRWDENFITNGVFEDHVDPYSIESKSILKGDLKELKREDSDGIYNKFAEILRHNVVSDKPNAFNKIINLFLCKICDEDRSESEEVKFQLKTGNREKTMKNF